MSSKMEHYRLECSDCSCHLGWAHASGVTEYALCDDCFQELTGMDESECSACSGSGYYDSDGNPKCGSCGGTGKEQGL